MDTKNSRRAFLKTTAVAGAAYLAGSPARASSEPISVIIVGAGAFGGWTALQLAQRGAKVTLLDAWGPGNSRASSGGETRTIRATYGPTHGMYAKMVARALKLWQEYEQRWNLQLFFRGGALRMAGTDDSYERAALPVLQEAGVRFEKLSSTECGKRWPQVNFDGVSWSVYEPDSGFLAARRACEAVLNAFLKEGGQYRQAEVTPGPIANNRMQGVSTSAEETLEADQYIFAPGPWLGKVFRFLAPSITPTRQEVFFFGTPAGDLRFSEARLPTWIDGGKTPFFGVPGNHWRGFKIADDTRGPVIDPNTMERQISQEKLEAARAYLRMRFPALAGAPLVESRVCQYENSTDHNFILDRHPEAQNVWIVGGGSGHGFKQGPVMGEMVADAVLGVSAPPAEMGLARLLNTKSH
ncbi:MAG TPA: FAD-dependent oxidoreductase [Candidatus Acidoferrum sp.]|nr:FAD-dependent oxidoreductase [Candidatus Acidoferrum sp.]